MAQEMMMQNMQGMPPGTGTQEAEAGRGTDMIIAHLTPGEIVIPRELLGDPQVMQMLQQVFQQGGADLAQYTVGDKANSVNPETGNPEFGWFGSIKKFISKVIPKEIKPILPIAAAALNFVPGFQGLGSALGSSILGTGAAGAGTLGSALLGGGASLLAGQNPLIGAVTGGIGANVGNLAGTPLANGVQGPVQAGSGLLGALSKSTGLTSGSIPSLGGLVGGSGGGSSFAGGLLANSLSGSLASAGGGIAQDAALKKQKDQLLAAQQQQLANLDTFDPSGITSDPGYEFNRAQGEQGLQRSLGASGNVFSGRALKAASDYNQNYADNAFKDYYQRWLTKTGAQNQLYGQGGDIRANATGAGSQNLAQTLSNVFGSPVGGYGTDTAAIRRMLGLAA